MCLERTPASHRLYSVKASPHTFRNHDYSSRNDERKTKFPPRKPLRFTSDREQEQASFPAAVGNLLSLTTEIVVRVPDPGLASDPSRHSRSVRVTRTVAVL